MRTRPFAIAAVALVGLTGCFPDPSAEPPATTTTTTTSTTSTTTSTTTTTLAPQADLQVSISGPSTPVYSLVFTATVSVSTLSAVPATGVSVEVTLPDGLTFASPPAETTRTFAVGSIAGSSSAGFTVDLVAGDVALGARSLLATASSDNATVASAMSLVTVAPLPLLVSITPDPANPPVIDISAPGTVSWTAGSNDSSAAITWTCETASTNPCPFVDALFNPQPTITFDTIDLQIDTYTLTATVTSTNPNFETNSTQVSFTTTSGGG